MFMLSLRFQTWMIVVAIIALECAAVATCQVWFPLLSAFVVVYILPISALFRSWWRSARKIPRLILTILFAWLWLLPSCWVCLAIGFELNHLCGIPFH